ncbi:MAG TPA: hypothetical protein VFH56_02775 [Acidimicrobiales bacterium]|nr:hypothetical protein [Acidimicrobiales bacterium]
MADPISDVDNPYGLMLYSVKTPTGSDLNLQTEGEANWYEQQRDRYLADNRFTNVSDLEDLSRLLTLEIMVYRWTTHLTQGFDYLQGRVNESELKTAIKEYSTEIRQLKGSLGIDRAQREKDKGETVGDYIAMLLKRAKEHGVHRDEQYSKSVTYIWELISMVQTHDRCDDQERRELDLTEASIIQWVRDTLVPEWDAMNQAYRENQKIWIADL